MCEEKGTNVSYRTMLHHVISPENQNLSRENFFFCGQNACKVVYFSKQTNLFKHQLRVFEEYEEDMLCYCFGVSKKQFQQALKEEKAEGIKDFILKNTKESLCACEVRNPSGRCCWGGFLKMEEVYEKDVKNHV